MAPVIIVLWGWTQDKHSLTAAWAAQWLEKTQYKELKEDLGLSLKATVQSTKKNSLIIKYIICKVA